jgi:tetratricopeptide (TPR) repeat protein
MDKALYRFLMAVAILLTVAWLGWSAYESFFTKLAPGDQAYMAGNRAFEDGRYQEALKEYQQAMTDWRTLPADERPADRASEPEHVFALRGRAASLMMLERYPEALDAYDHAIELVPEFAAPSATRGILHDRIGNYPQALSDYERSLSLEPELAEGPNWLTRFLRLQPEPPPTVADRAVYLKEQLAKPEGERLLRVPEQDAQQRPYKM